jgi:hypothetical protein
MRPLFLLSVLMAIFAVSCTTSHSDVAPALAANQPVSAERSYIRCAALEGQPQSDPCSAKTMAGQRLRR